MSDEVFSQRFYGHREPAWHGKGRVGQEGETAMQVWSGMTPYGLELRPAHVWMSAGEGIPQDFVETSHRFIVRTAVPDDPVERIFGVVSDQYQIVTPQQICEAFDRVSQGLPVETMGSLGYGEKFFIVAKIGELQVKSDKSDDYLFVASPYQPGESITLLRTGVRVVCANTWRAALGSRQGKFLWRGNHNNANLAQEMEIWLEHSIRQALGQTQEIQQFMDILAAWKMQKKDVYEALFRVYPNAEDDVASYPAKLQEDRRAKIEAVNKSAKRSQEAVERLFDGAGTGLSDPKIKGTAWALFQAATEYEDYRKSTKDPTDSIVLGERADNKYRAGSVLVEMARKAM